LGPENPNEKRIFLESLSKRDSKEVKMVSVDEGKCIGCGSCASVCEKVFEMKDGKAHVKAGQEGSKEACVKEAVDACPVDAITG
jgi:ferredoxin